MESVGRFGRIGQDSGRQCDGIDFDVVEFRLNV